jgi:hypothetical protein
LECILGAFGTTIHGTKGANALEDAWTDTRSSGINYLPSHGAERRRNRRRRKGLELVTPVPKRKAVPLCNCVEIQSPAGGNNFLMVFSRDIYNVSYA